MENASTSFSIQQADANVKECHSFSHSASLTVLSVNRKKNRTRECHPVKE